MRLKIVRINRRRFTQFIQPGDFVRCHFPFRCFEVIRHLFRCPDANDHRNSPRLAQQIIQRRLRDCSLVRRGDFFQFVDDIINFLLIGNCGALTESCAFGRACPRRYFPDNKPPASGSRSGFPALGRHITALIRIPNHAPSVNKDLEKQ